MRINYGCGRKVLDDYFNIDAAANPLSKRPPDLLHALQFNPDGTVSNKTPLEDGCADELIAMHVIEHFFYWNAPHVIQEWARLLKQGGKIVLELPNVILAAQNLLKGSSDQYSMWSFYGDPGHKDPYMCHLWAYSPATIKTLLAENGFAKIKILPPETHGKKTNRDMRVEAIKA